MSAHLPPCLPGLPLAGSALDFYRDPVGLCRRGYRELGPIFSLKLGPKRACVVIEPEHAAFLLQNTGTLFSFNEVYRFAEPIIGTGVSMSDEQFKRFRRDVLTAPFSGKRVASAVPGILDETTAWMDTLGDSGSFELEKSFGALILASSVRSIVGSRFRRSIGPETWDLFQDIFNGVDFLLPPSLPLPRFRRRERAKRALLERIAPIVREGPSEADGGSVFVEALSEYVRDQTPSQAERAISMGIMGAIWGAHGTTTGHLCWTLITLLQNPEYLHRVLDQLDAVVAETGELNGAALRKIDLLDWAIREAERMHPVMPLIPRHNAEEYELGGYRIPKGWLTMACPSITHRLPSLFPEPDRYDPARFSPARGGDEAARRLIGFGGAPRRCPGESFAYLEIAVILSLVLRRFTFELLSPSPRSAKGFVVSGPEAPCVVRYRRRERPS